MVVIAVFFLRLRLSIDSIDHSIELHDALKSHIEMDDSWSISSMGL